MIEYAKILLPAVSDWKVLFRKELIKCVNWLDATDKAAFQQWCVREFYGLHPEILNEVFWDVTNRQTGKGMLISLPYSEHQPMRKTG